ncbi:MFS transporter [Candidatus Roizmanbacteria bacterium]|nr:MFS transporter [Candidatus Roizmanbacteria bacterium]
MLKKIFSSFKWDNITKLSLIYFFSAFYLYLPFVTLYYQHRGLSLLQISSLQSIIIGITFFTNIPTGIFADKIGRKISIILSIGLQLLGEILFFFARSYPEFILIAIIAGIGFSFIIGTVSALTYETLKEEGKEGEMGKATGSRMATESLARIIAPFLGGLLIAPFIVDRFMLLIAITIIAVSIAFILTFTLKEPKNKTSAQKKPVQLFLDGLTLLKSNKSLRRIVLLSLFTNPLISYLFILYQPYFVKSGVAPWMFGLMLSTGAIFSLLGNKFAYKFERVLGVERGILFATLFPALLYFSMSAIYHPVLSFIFVCLIYLPLGLQDPLFTDYQNKHISDENRATMISLISMLNNIYIATMGLIIGYLADTSLNLAFLCIGGVIFFSALIFRINNSHIQKSGPMSLREA